MGTKTLIESGQLQEAIRITQTALKQHPADLSKRDLLQTLLCISGDLERADKQLALIAAQDPETQIFVHVQRQLLRAEKARQECFFEGRVPAFPHDITDTLETSLKIIQALREGNLAEAKALISQIKVKSFRDMDDVCAGFLEIYLQGGVYAWVDPEQVVSIDFHPVKRLIDLIWRRVTITMPQEIILEAYMPVVYITTPPEDEKARLAQITHWHDSEGIIRGSGQRLFLLNNKAMPILEISHAQIS